MSHVVLLDVPPKQTGIKELFSIPAVRTRQGERTEELSRKQQTAWMGRIVRLQGIPRVFSSLHHT